MALQTPLATLHKFNGWADLFLTTPNAGLEDAYCLELRRTGIGHFDVAHADEQRVVPLSDALSFLPELRLGPEDARRAGHGVAVPGAVPSASAVRLTDGEGLIALAEPRERGLLKPVVGFRG